MIRLRRYLIESRINRAASCAVQPQRPESKPMITGTVPYESWRTEMREHGAFVVQSSPFANRHSAQRSAANARSRRQFDQTWRVVNNATGETWESKPNPNRIVMRWKIVTAG